MLPLLLVSMDVSVLYFAVPFIARDLEPSSTQQLWIFDVYGFVLAGMLITMGSLGDRIGRRRLLLIGAAAFSLASLGAAYSQTAGQLIAPRGAGDRGGDPDALDARADPQHVPRREAAAHRDRRLDRRHDERHRARAGAQRRPAEPLLVGVGLPDQRAVHGLAAGPRAGAGAGVPRRRPAGST
jgi:hypothetical protein